MVEKFELMTDEELMFHYQEGSETSFGILFKRHAPRLLSYYQKRVGEPLASDLFQELFQKLHKVRLSYKSKYPFLPWFFLLARQVLIDHTRKKESRLEKMFQDEFDDSIIVESDQREELLQEIEWALALLDEKERGLILNRYLKDWSFAEIAHDLETSEGGCSKND